MDEARVGSTEALSDLGGADELIHPNPPDNHRTTLRGIQGRTAASLLTFVCKYSVHTFVISWTKGVPP
jgi:hypothetical protein